MNKFSVIVASILAVGLIAATCILGNTYKYKFRSSESINVTGNALKDFNADLVKWRATFSRKDYDLRVASDQLKADQTVVKNFLISQGINPKEIVFEAVNISKDFQYGTDANGNSISQFTGYNLSQDAKQRAENIATKSGASLGKLKQADLGIFQITGKNDNEEYSAGGSLNTTSRQKTAQITVRASYNSN